MIRLIHAADFHLDSPFSALTDDMAVERRREQRRLLERLKALVIEKNADIVLLSGDLLDSERSYFETSEQLTGVLAQIPAYVFIAPGNHDHFSVRSPYAGVKWPDNIHIFKTSQITGVGLPELNLKVWGAGFTSNSAQPILRGFELNDTSLINIMALHGDVGSTSSPYNPITEAEIAASGLDYLALGHQHAFTGLKKSGRTYYAYPGCPEGRGFDETGEKGVIFACVDKSGCKLDFVPMGGRKYEILEIDLSRAADIYEAIDAAIPTYSQRDIYRLILKGSMENAPDLSQVLRRFQSRFYKLEVRDQTDIKYDIWAETGEDTLKGLFLKRLKERYDTAKSQRERDTVVLAVRYGLAAIDNREDI